MPVHTNISPNGAFFGGEMWFSEDGTVTCNFGSARYPFSEVDSSDPQISKKLEKPLKFPKGTKEYEEDMGRVHLFAEMMLNLGYPNVRVVLPGDRFKPDAECMVYQYKMDANSPNQKFVVGWVEPVFGLRVNDVDLTFDGEIAGRNMSPENEKL